MKYRFLIFGAGAIGTYIGVSLANHGNQVHFLERQDDLPELSNRGLLLRFKDTTLSIDQPNLISSLDNIQKDQFDLAVLAIKTYHLDALLPGLSKFQDNLPPLLCLLNGVESEGILAKAVGPNKVIPGTVTSAVERFDKGNAVISKKRGIGIAESHPMTNELINTFEEAGLKTTKYANPQDMKWSKLITNLLGNASSAILNMTTSQVYTDPELFHLERKQIKEVLGVMRLLNIKVVNLPGIPVRLLVSVIDSLPASLSRPILTKQIGGGRGEKMPSFHIDLHSGKGNSEVNHLNGAVVRAGKALGYPTPVNQLLTETLNSLLIGQEPLEKYDHKPHVLLDMLKSKSPL
jgi:2-dehydropantoate 2-reductase